MAAIKHFFISLSLILTSGLTPSIAFSQTDTTLDAQKADCAKNSAAEWSLTLNKCVGKVADRQTRHDAQDCNKIEDLNQRAECHKKLAEQKTGLSSDPNSLNQGGTTGSMVMNGIGTAYAIVGMIQGVGKEKKDSACTSKKIFGVTAMAGFASDIFLKIRAKKKVDELQGKYKLETKQGAYDAQVKALQYLKEEQETVADIASMEKKRNMLLMLGYGAASVMAIYEMWSMGTMNAGCFKPDPPAKTESAATPPSTETAATPEAKPDPKPTPASEAKPVVADTPEAAKPEATATPTQPETKITANPTPDTAPPVVEKPGVTIEHTTKGNTQFLDIKQDPTTGARSAIIDNTVKDYKTGTVLGKVDYSAGVIKYNNGSTFPINTVNSTGFSAPVSLGKTGLSGNGFDWRSAACKAGKC